MRWKAWELLDVMADAVIDELWGEAPDDCSDFGVASWEEARAGHRVGVRDEMATALAAIEDRLGLRLDWDAEPPLAGGGS